MSNALRRRYFRSHLNPVWALLARHHRGRCDVINTGLFLLYLSTPFTVFSPSAFFIISFLPSFFTRLPYIAPQVYPWSGFPSFQKNVIHISFHNIFHFFHKLTFLPESMMYSISGLFINISSRFCSINKLYVGYIIHLTSMGRSIGNSGQGLTFFLKSKLHFKISNTCLLEILP